MHCASDYMSPNHVLGIHKSLCTMSTISTVDVNDDLWKLSTGHSRIQPTHDFRCKPNTTVRAVLLRRKCCLSCIKSLSILNAMAESHSIIECKRWIFKQGSPLVHYRFSPQILLLENLLEETCHTGSAVHQYTRECHLLRPRGKK
jgi:hypothetical protein